MSPPGTRRTCVRLRPVPDLQEPVALLAEEELAIPNADVHVDHVSVLEQVDHAIDATGLPESAREEAVAAARDGQKRHGPPEGGHGGSLQRPVAANADQERAARAAPRRPATQAVQIGKGLQHGPMSARAKRLAQPGSRVEGAVVPGGRRRDDLDGARLARECASPYCSHGSCMGLCAALVPVGRAASRACSSGRAPRIGVARPVQAGCQAPARIDGTGRSYRRRTFAITANAAP